MVRMLQKMLALSGLLLLLTTQLGCEVIARYRCQWYMIPDLEKKHLVEPGWVSVCLRNYDIGKQKCALKAKFEMAEATFGKPFRYVDVEIFSKVYPREVKSVKVCEK